MLEDKIMTIEYFEIEGSVISRSTIDTTHVNYICHTDTHVRVRYEYENIYGDTQQSEKTRHRSFEKVRENLISAAKEHIAREQQELSILERSTDFNKYLDMIYKRKSPIKGLH